MRWSSLLRDLDNGRASFRRVILETTGLADPAPVLQTAMAHPYLVMRYRLDGVITVVDAVNGARHARRASRSRQAGRGRRPHRADQDRPRRHARAPQRHSKRCSTRLRALNPAAPILDAAAGEATPARLLDCGLYDPERKIPDVARWLALEAYAQQRAAGTITTTITTSTATTSASAPSRS